MTRFEIAMVGLLASVLLVGPGCAGMGSRVRAVEGGPAVAMGSAAVAPSWRAGPPPADLRLPDEPRRSEAEPWPGALEVRFGLEATACRSGPDLDCEPFGGMAATR